MRRLIQLVGILLLPTIALAQTQSDRKNFRGQSTFDSLRNTQAIPFSGATPAVGLGNVFKTANVGGTTITDFTGGGDAQQIYIICRDVNTIIANSATIATTGGSNQVCALNTVFSFVRDAVQGKWVQVTSGGGGGGGSPPSAPNLSFQFNNSGAFGGSIFNYTTPGILREITNDPTITTVSPLITLTLADPALAGNNLNGVQMGTSVSGNSPTGVVSYVTNSFLAGGLLGTKYVPAGYFQSAVIGNTGAPSIAQGVRAIAADNLGDAATGQTLYGVEANVAMNRAAGNNLTQAVGVQVSSPSDNHVTFAQNTPTETASNVYGLNINDQLGVSTVEQAAIKIRAQTRSAAGNTFAIKSDGGISEFDAGTFTTDLNPFNLNFTLNNGATVFNGVKWTAINTAYAAGSKDFQWCVGVLGANCSSLDPLGNFSVTKTIGSGDGSAAGNVQFLQGALPAILANNVGFAAPASVSAGGFIMTLPGAPCNGTLSVTTSGNYGTMACTGGTGNAKRQTAQTAALSAIQLCAAANCPAGEYEVKVHGNSTVTCATPGAAALGFTLTFTDDAGTKTAQVIPLSLSGALTFTATIPLGNTTNIGSGTSGAFWSTGVNDITLNTTYTACTAGTGTYSYSAEVLRLQ